MGFLGGDFLRDGLLRRSYGMGWNGIYVWICWEGWVGLFFTGWEGWIGLMVEIGFMGME